MIRRYKDIKPENKFQWYLIEFIYRNKYLTKKHGLMGRLIISTAIGLFSFSLSEIILGKIKFLHILMFLILFFILDYKIYELFCPKKEIKKLNKYENKTIEDSLWNI